MAAIKDQDRFFSGNLNASSPKHLGAEGDVRRLINGRFVEGAITNAIGFDELDVSYATNERIFASSVSYNELLRQGDVQLVAPLDTAAGQFLVVVISGRMLRIDLDEFKAIDITPIDASLPAHSYDYPLSYIDNSGGISGVGGANGNLVIFNYPNRTIFVSQYEARTANPRAYEMPPSRMGVTAGLRSFIITGDNLMLGSDPLGGASPLAPLTFVETLRTTPPADYLGQFFTIGSSLDRSRVTAIARMPNYFSASQEFLARTVIVSTVNQKYVISASSPRETWDSSQFITYAGSSDGIAGPLAVTNVGDVIFYISTTGRLKTIGQDQQRETGLSEVFGDEAIGQYLCKEESSFHYRHWYRSLDHSRGVIKYNRDRIYATTYPILAPAIGQFGQEVYSPTHRALAVGSIDPATRLGPTAAIAWEGFYDWMKPVGIATMGENLYVVSKDEYGRVTYHKENFLKLDDHPTSIFTRGYLAGGDFGARSMSSCELYFRVLDGPVKVSLHMLIDEKWVEVAQCTVENQSHEFSFREARGRSNGPAIPLRIDIDHKGCRFELESIRISGEGHSSSSSKK